MKPLNHRLLDNLDVIPDVLLPILQAHSPFDVLNLFIKD